MSMMGENADRNREDQPQEGQVEATQSLPVQSASTHCDEAAVRQSIESIEQAALDSHRDRGITDDELRITLRAADSARRNLADGEVNPCRVLPEMLRQVLRGELEDDEDET